MYLLDTDVVTLFLHHKKQQPHLERRIVEASANSLWTSIITIDEAIGGAYKLINGSKSDEEAIRGCKLLQKIMRDISAFPILPYQPGARKIFQSMSAATKRLGSNDCKIAAIALDYDFTVVTRNVQHFQAIPNVKYEDWTGKNIVRR